MSFFNKVLASIGVGGAKVDTKLEKSEFTAGEKMQGVVEVIGGNLEQQIDAIYLTVNTTYIRESNDRKHTDVAAIQKYKVIEPFTIGANEKKVIPFSMTLPEDTPVTYGSTRVWVSTGLDIKNSVDPTDKDYITVRPTRLAGVILEAVEQLGFKLRKVECEKASYKLGSRYPFVQEFEFVPISGFYRKKLDELEILFLSQSTHSAEILMQVDRRARGLGGLLAEALEMDEKFIRMSLNSQDIPTIKDKLKRAIGI
ncbi:sporulation-control protein [Psychrobacillus sp. OK028]|uniref:sporulation protein n=1 Tax=Psychrobacillus sp. OK028 TaxID=1884359 RepID=UPI00088D557C|nr:sporulation protein [Psychrobacillus sp. OK028]SDN63086.1 sporulation-control protein [Psychrobacillus sp. OK028]